MEVNQNGGKYAALKRLLGVAVIFMWIPHLLSISLTRHYYGHSKMHFVDLVTPFPGLKALVENMTIGNSDKRSSHVTNELDMEHTLPFILTQNRVKRGIMGCYHLCNSILIYNFVVNMMHKRKGDSDIYINEGGREEEDEEKRLVDKLMLSRVLQRAQPHLFSRFMKISMYLSLASVPVTMGLNIYLFDYQNENRESLLFVLWLWYAPYSIACTTHAIALFCFTLHAHTLDIEMFVERLNADRLDENGKNKSNWGWQWNRDKAFLEEYLFHQLLVHRSAAVWELSLACSLLCSMTLFILGVTSFANRVEFNDVENINALLETLIYTFLGLVGFVSIFHAIAMLNGRLGKPILAVTEASTSDWCKLGGKHSNDSGGRDHLLAYFKSNPIVFKIYGIEINYQVYVIVGSSMFSVFLLIATYYIGGPGSAR